MEDLNFQSFFSLMVRKRFVFSVGESSSSVSFRFPRATDEGEEVAEEGEVVS